MAGAFSSYGIQCRWREPKARAANGKTGADRHRPKGDGVPTRIRERGTLRIKGIAA
jgi:hypothetical protein